MTRQSGLYRPSVAVPVRRSTRNSGAVEQQQENRNNNEESAVDENNDGLNSMGERTDEEEENVNTIEDYSISYSLFF